MHAKSRPITSTEVHDQIKALVRALRKGDTSWDTPWAADQLFTRNAISLVMKFRRDIAQQRKPNDDKAYIRWMIGWATIAGAKKMASRYEEQLQDCISPSAASHPIRSQPVNDVRYNKQIRVCTSPRVASSPRSSNQPEDEDASNNTNEWIVVGKKGSNRIDSTTKAAPKS